jgi:SAM-dependent methyltransferase
LASGAGSATSADRPRRDRLNLAATARILGLADYVIPVAIRVFASLALADAMAAGNATPAAIADAAGCEPGPVERLLRALAEAEVVDEPEPGRFTLTPIGELLTTAHPMSMRDLYPILPAELRAWGRADTSFRTGSAAFPLAAGETYWDYLAHDAEAGRMVDRFQAAATRLDLLTLVRVYPWSQVTSVVDVGGGNGTFIAGLLRRFAHLRGVLFDLPHVADGAGAVLAEAGVADRCDVVGGDFFSGVPGGHDGYVLKAIVSGWGDDDAIRLLAAVRAVIAPEGRVLLIDPVLDGPDGFTFGNVSHLASLVMVDGPERTEADYRELLAAAGFALSRVIPRPTLPIIEARPA